VFLGQSTEDQFISYETNPIGNPAVGNASLFQGDVVTSSIARISYGHGLRPIPIPRDIAPNEPFVRVADGGFGDAFGKTNIYGDGDFSYRTIDDMGGAATGTVLTNDVSAAERNRFAGDWPLGRQTLLLHDSGGIIMGLPPVSGPSAREAIISARREYAPYIRDLESEHRFAIDDFTPDPGSSACPRSTAVSIRVCSSRASIHRAGSVSRPGSNLALVSWPTRPRSRPHLTGCSGVT